MAESSERNWQRGALRGCQMNCGGRDMPLNLPKDSSFPLLKVDALFLLPALSTKLSSPPWRLSQNPCLSLNSENRVMGSALEGLVTQHCGVCGHPGLESLGLCHLNSRTAFRKFIMTFFSKRWSLSWDPSQLKILCAKSSMQVMLIFTTWQTDLSMALLSLWWAPSYHRYVQMCFSIVLIAMLKMSSYLTTTQVTWALKLSAKLQKDSSTYGMQIASSWVWKVANKMLLICERQCNLSCWEDWSLILMSIRAQSSMQGLIWQNSWVHWLLMVKLTCSFWSSILSLLLMPPSQSFSSSYIDCIYFMSPMWVSCSCL